MDSRASAVLLHITSLSSPGGIGTLGEAAYSFCDFLSDAGVRYWQLLPLVPIGPGNSPYQSPGGFAGNPLLIDPFLLAADGLLTDGEAALGSDGPRVDYDAVGRVRGLQLRQAFARAPAALLEKAAQFTKRIGQLEKYCLYRAIGAQQDGAPFWEWPEELAGRRPDALEKVKTELARELSFVRLEQYLFFSQLARLRAHAAARGVGFIGDLPLYVAPDSADVWANQPYFLLDEARRPREVAGVGPDAFSQTGQRWGNPLYDWDAIVADDWRWWIDRVRSALGQFDWLRLDHFRGFDSYWAIPAGAPSATAGEWRDGPGMALFDTLRFVLGRLPFIAEDLGELTPRARALVRQTGLPGMKVLQFAFDPAAESAYLPHRMIQNAVCCTGTHDNDTLRGWLSSLDSVSLDYCRRYLNAAPGQEPEALIRAAFASVCDLCVIPMQDFLGLGGEARMNTPGTVGPHNWSWRLRPGDLTPALAQSIRNLNELYYRM